MSGQSAWPEDALDVLDRRRYVGAEDGGESGGRSGSVQAALAHASEQRATEQQTQHSCESPEMAVQAEGYTMQPLATDALGQMQRKDAIIAAELAAYRKKHRSNFIENTAVTVAKGTVEEKIHKEN